MPTDNAYLLALEVEVEAVFRRHMATYHAAAQAAAARAFRVVAITEDQTPGEKVSCPRRARRKPSAPYRSAETIAALATQLQSAVLSQPGQTMRELAARLNTPVADLAVPMARLRRTGRVRRVGSRQFTRYYPKTGLSVAQPRAALAEERWRRAPFNESGIAIEEKGGDSDALFARCAGDRHHCFNELNARLALGAKRPLTPQYRASYLLLSAVVGWLHTNACEVGP